MSKQNQKNQNKKDQKKKKGRGFTLVELIVVITILAILGTIAFISLQNYTKNSRDSQRMADINSIEKSLGIYMAEKGSYPDPDGGTNITYSGGLAWTQGTVGDTMMTNLKNINKKPTDPLTYNEYTYSVTSYKNEYQIGSILEIGLVSNLGITEKANAASLISKKAMAMVKGNYNQVMLKVSTGSTDYVLAVPSIINADLSDLDLLSIINKKQLVYNNRENLPDSYKGAGYSMTGGFDYVPTGNKLEIYKGSLSLLNKDTGLKKEMIETLKQAYNGSIVGSDFPYADVIKIDTSNIEKVEILADNLLSNGNITKNEEISGTPFISSFSGGVSLIKKDNLGNIYVGGNNMDEAWDYGYVSKYDSQGNQLWKKSLRGTSYEAIYSMEVDSNGNVYAGGEFRGTINLGSGISITSAGNDDGYLIKLDTNGNPLWAKNISTSYYEYVYGVNLDGNGDIYINGTFQYNYTINFGGGITVSSSGSQDGFFAKYNSSGVPIFAKKIGGAYNDGINKMIFDNNGNKYIFGSIQSPTMNFGSGVSIVKNSLNYDYDGYVVKYDSNWIPLWAKSIGSADGGSDGINNLIGDKFGNIYLIGKFFGTLNFGGGITITSAGYDDGYIAKYDSNGNPLWAKSLGGTGNDNIGNLVLDTDGNPYVSGGFNGNVTIGGTTYTSRGSNDSYIVKYDKEGNNIWTKQIGGTGSDSISIMFFNNEGKLIVLGSFSNSINLDSGYSVTSKGNNDGLLIKYDTNGDINSLNNVGGTGSESISNYMYNNGELYVGGRFNGTMNFLSKSITSVGGSYGAGTYSFGVKVNKYLDVIQ
ncbi:prepilin-type N-terminal cleavage/methylation domain-containing protein [Candidatus Gracilibacteria bacterium]|nr:prepilin-type N-terminal cleavage/methylation domain-containing protein [Candidatus Gracilibacteria bacterium]